MICGTMHEMRAVREMRNARHAWRVCDVCDVYDEMYEIWHEMMWNTIWNDVKWCIKWREMLHEMTWNVDHWFWLHAMRCNLGSLIFDRNHNLIILFLISLRIWSIGVDVKLTQQDVKNLHLQIAPPYHPFCKEAKWNEWERRAKVK